ncbi:non-hydrolyzing UDP-N-acetylglucosamine 2-epimerase [Saccharomonospora sp. CUA-673]|uniref:non-hydrolyzing UDP-N-acetylglucosamine 2-epimerase n=1 Tax=Saccharomonospora sp. CUA-673 TaxID=1904969 RepID=UPI000B2E9D77|nr:UDP-N-acetylglucosamine 2-epimerase (non-hydrolyzing) [Saccharomonospora sp. CUA-673]
MSTNLGAGGAAPRTFVLVVVGTRPEAVKLAPVVSALADSPWFRPVLLATGQHTDLVDQALATFGLAPDERLAVARRGGGQAELMSAVLTGLDQVITRVGPAAVIVQGDTTSTLAGALAAFWRSIPVVHVEAGLRSGDLAAPFPEELNRRLVTAMAALHLAPTPAAARNLRAEAVPDDRIVVAGNTAVDALRSVAGTSAALTEPALDAVAARVRSGHRRLLLVTAHRRESWGEPLRRVARAVADLARAVRDLDVVVPAHPNPDVRAVVHEELGHVDRVLVTEPLSYGDLATLLSMSTLVLSDSGGIQEEAPTFGVPVLVLRTVTERTEAVDAGCARLVGTTGSSSPRPPWNCSPTRMPTPRWRRPTTRSATASPPNAPLRPWRICWD